MGKQSKQERGTGQNKESSEKQSLAESSPMNSENSSNKEQDAGPSKKSSIPKRKSRKKSTAKSSANGSANGAENTQKRQKSAMPVLKMPTAVKRQEEALKRLRVKPSELATAPQITPTLKSCVRGGLKAALDAMRFAPEDPEIAAFLAVYDKVPVGDRERLPWEAICLSAGINPKHLMSSALLAVTSHCATRSRFIMVSNHPDVTQKRIEYAKLASGERDRTQLDIMVGALPSAKGPTFIGKAVFGGPPQQASQDDDGEETEALPAVADVNDVYADLFPNTKEIQDKLVPIRQRLLED